MGDDTAVAVRTPLTPLLMLGYRRQPADGRDIEVVGDRRLLGFWLDHVSFG